MPSQDAVDAFRYQIAAWFAGGYLEIQRLVDMAPIDYGNLRIT